MKRVSWSLLLAGLLLPGRASVAQDSKGVVSIIQPLVRDEELAGKRLTVLGYLRIYRQPHHGLLSFLYLHQEDADNATDNGLLVIPSRQMIHDKEEIDRRYVLLNGSWQCVGAGGGGFACELRDIRSYAIWPDPSRPSGLGARQTGQSK